MLLMAHNNRNDTEETFKHNLPYEQHILNITRGSSKRKEYIKIF